MRTSTSSFLAAAMLAVAVSTLSAAEKTVRTNYLVDLKRGISLTQFTNGLGQQPIHEFTVRDGSNVVRCVAHFFDYPFQKYYFLFLDDRLKMVCEYPQFEYSTVPYRGSRRAIRKPWKPEERVKRVMESKDLTGTALEESIAQNRKPANTGSAQFPPGFISLLAPGLKAAKKTETEVAQKFDPYKVRLGDPLETVEGHFGNAHHAETFTNDHERRCYGWPQYGVNIKVWVMVGFKDGRVIEIFSDDFFDTEKILKSLK